MIIFVLLLFIWTFLQEARSLSDYTEMLQKFQKTFWGKKAVRSLCFLFWHLLHTYQRCSEVGPSQGPGQMLTKWCHSWHATHKQAMTWFHRRNTQVWIILGYEHGQLKHAWRTSHVLVHCNVNSYSVLANQLNSNKRCLKKKGNGFWFSPCSFVNRTSMRQLWYMFTLNVDMTVSQLPAQTAATVL